MAKRYLVYADTAMVGTDECAYVESDCYRLVENFADDFAYDNFQNHFTVEDYADYLGYDDYEDDDIYSLYGFTIEEYKGDDEDWEDHRNVIIYLPN